MATSIFFTESKDFKLIKDRILNHEDNYLVYVYADTTNVRIPKELIMQLPKYGNNLIWVDTAEMDSSDLSHHIVLTIGQLVNPEEEIDFYIVSKSSKLEKTIIFLRNQGIPAEGIGQSEDQPKAKKAKGTGRRGRPRKVQVEEQAVIKTGKRGRPRKVQAEVIPVTETTEAPKKRRGRPSKVQAEVLPVVETTEAPKKKRGRPSKIKEEVIKPEPKKRGRKPAIKPAFVGTAVVAKKEKKVKAEKIVKPAKDVKKPKKVKAEKKVKAVKEVKARKQRIDKEITEEMVQDKLNLYATTDADAVLVMTRLFNLKKVARPKFESKLVDLIKDITLEDDTFAERILTQLQEMQVLESTGPGGRVFYKD